MGLPLLTLIILIQVSQYLEFWTKIITCRCGYIYKHILKCPVFTFSQAQEEDKKKKIYFSNHVVFELLDLAAFFCPLTGLGETAFR